MILRTLVALAATASIVLAQDRVYGNTGAENSTHPTAKDGDITIHYVYVGKANNNFYPNSIRAQPGDIVSFQFFPSNHSVIRASYGYPCIPYDYSTPGGKTFYSGFHPTREISENPPTWNLTINDTQPIFYYCGAPGSCTDWGMVGGINLNASTSIATQISLARQADYMLLPGDPFPSEQEEYSMSALAHTATTATVSVTVTKSNKPTSSYAYGNGVDHHDDDSEYNHDSGLSTGAIAGIAVGAGVVVIAILAGLFLLMRRTKKLKENLDRQQATAQVQGRGDPNVMSPAAYGSAGQWNQQAHMSQLPPYQQYAQYDQSQKDVYKQDGSVANMDIPARSMSPHSQYTQGYYTPFQSPDPNQHRFTSYSELGSNAPPRSPPIELDAPGHDMSERSYR